MNQKKIRMKIGILCLLLFVCLAATSCSNNEEGGKYKELEENIKANNQDSLHYLVYSEWQEIWLHLGTDLSKLDIEQLDLYKSSDLCYENVSDFTVSEDEIKITLDKFVPFFNRIVIHTEDGEKISLYVGKYYLEKESEEMPIIGKVVLKSIREECDDNSSKYICIPEKKYRKKYKIQTKCPKLAETYFNKKRYEKDSSTVITYELKEKYKNSLKIEVDIQFFVIDRETGKTFSDMLSTSRFNLD